MIRAANIIRRAWHLLGQCGPFTVTQHPADEYSFFSVGATSSAPALLNEEVLLGEIPCHMNAATRPAVRAALPHSARDIRNAMSAPARTAARHVLPGGTRGMR
jgi:hypothetical protein